MSKERYGNLRIGDDDVHILEFHLFILQLVLNVDITRSIATRRRPAVD